MTAPPSAGAGPLEAGAAPGVGGATGLGGDCGGQRHGTEAHTAGKRCWPYVVHIGACVCEVEVLAAGHPIVREVLGIVLAAHGGGGVRGNSRMGAIRFRLVGAVPLLGRAVTGMRWVGCCHPGGREMSGHSMCSIAKGNAQVGRQGCRRCRRRANCTPTGRSKHGRGVGRPRACQQLTACLHSGK